ncbi:hypothetical protein Tco_1144114 [Tanacetum coccineum]
MMHGTKRQYLMQGDSEKEIDEKKEGLREEEQAFLDELERLKRQEKEANEEDEASGRILLLRKKAIWPQVGLSKIQKDDRRSVVRNEAKVSLLRDIMSKRKSIKMDVKQCLPFGKIDEEDVGSPKTINNVRHITAKVAGKPVSISEASIRSDLLFDDANGIDSLPNQAIFDAIQLMGGVLLHKDHLKQNLTPSPAQLGKFCGNLGVQRDPLFDEIAEDTTDHMETENAQDVGRIKDIVGEEKKNDENILSTEDVLSTDKEKVSTNKEKVSTNRPIVSTDGSKVSIDKQIEGTDEQIKGTDEQRKGTNDHTEEGSVTQTTQPPPTSTIFGDDEIIAKVLLNMSQAKAVSREKEKGVEIDPKDKGKKKIEEEMNLRSPDLMVIPEALRRRYKNSLQVMKRWTWKIQEEPDRLLAEKLQEEKKEGNLQLKKEQIPSWTIIMNEKGIDSSKKEEVKEESKEEESNRKRKLVVVDYEILDKKYPIKGWKTECLGTKPQVDKAEHLEEINQNVVIRSNGQKRYFYQRIMFNPDDEDKFWNSQQDWNIVSWKLHGFSGVHTLMTEAGLVIHMLIEKKYHLRKKVLLQMLELKLESEEDSTVALELIRFVKKQVAGLESEDPNEDEEDL